MANYDEFDLDQYQRVVLQETQKEWQLSQPGELNECEIVEFESRKEFGKKRKFPTKIKLFVRGDKAYVIKDGEIQPNKKAIAPDVMACEVLNHLPWE